MKNGTVKFFNASKGFGFVTEDDSNTEYFVHVTGIIDEINEGDTVEFELKEGRKGMNAVNVRIYLIVTYIIFYRKPVHSDEAFLILFGSIDIRLKVRKCGSELAIFGHSRTFQNTKGIRIKKRRDYLIHKYFSKTFTRIFW